jgi:hypothetical protein
MNEDLRTINPKRLLEVRDHCYSSLEDIQISIIKPYVCISGLKLEPEFLNCYLAQGSIPRNKFRQPM